MTRAQALLATATLITLAAAAAPDAAAQPAAPAAPAAPDDAAAALRTPGSVTLRAHVARVGDYGLTHAARVTKDTHRREGAAYDDVGVVATRGDRVRIVHDEDDARMLLWIDAADLASVITRESRVAGKGDVGVWLLPGAKVTAARRGARRRVTAAFRGEHSVTGMVPAVAIGKTFTWGPPPARLRDGRYAPAILDAPGGRALLPTPKGLEVEVVAPGSDGWSLAEHRSPTLRVRGWVRTDELADRFDLGTLTGGSGYGMSHVRRVDVAAGTCFHAGAGGPLVGVQLADTQRYAPTSGDGWYELYVGNAWGLFTVHARATSVDAAGKPVFARCR